MTARTRWLILGFAIVGLAFATASAYVHYKLRIDPTYVSPCDINAKFSCSVVYLSQYGSVAGIPVALGGVIWFALVALLAGFSRPVTAEEAAESPTGGYLFVLATIGLASILYLGYASFFRLKTYCVLCMGTYVSVIGIFIVSGLSGSIAMTQLPLRLLRDLKSWATRPAIAVTAMLYLAGAASVVAFFPKEGAVVQQKPVEQDMKKLFEDAWVQQPRVTLNVPAGTAKVVVVKFNDWLCPGCKSMHYAFKPILDKYEKENPGAVKYVVKDWPWNTKCNFNAGQSIQGHEGSCYAAAAVRMARDRGKENEMVEWLFANLESLEPMGDPKAPNAVKAQAEKMLGITDFDKQYAAKLPEIQKDVTEGGGVNVNNTPTYFINGVRCQDANGRTLPPEFLDLAIQIELKKAGK